MLYRCTDCTTKIDRQLFLWWDVDFASPRWPNEKSPRSSAFYTLRTRGGVNRIFFKSETICAFHWNVTHGAYWYGMVWYGMVNVDLYSAIITKVSNALDTLVSGEKPGFQTLSDGLVVLLCAEVVRQRVPDHGPCTANARRPTVVSRCRGTTISIQVIRTFTSDLR